MLRLLASYNVINCAVEVNGDSNIMTRRYGPAPVRKWLTKNEDDVSLAPLCLMSQDKVSLWSRYSMALIKKLTN